MLLVEGLFSRPTYRGILTCGDGIQIRFSSHLTHNADTFDAFCSEGITNTHLLRLLQEIEEGEEWIFEALDQEVSRCYNLFTRFKHRFLPLIYPPPMSGAKFLMLIRYEKAGSGKRQDAASLPAPTMQDRVSAQKALWLLVRSEETLKANERKDLQECCLASQDLATLHTLARSPI